LGADFYVRAARACYFILHEEKMGQVASVFFSELDEQAPTPKVIVIDGIIAAGKTVFIAGLRRYLQNMGFRVVVVDEPVEQWKKTGRLEQFYKDPQKRAYQFQTMAFHTRIMNARDIWNEWGNDVDFVLMERCPNTDPIFMNLLLNNKTIDKTEMEDYMALWNLWLELAPYTPRYFIYLRPSLEAVMNRLKERSRKGESAVTEEYQRALQAEHDRHLPAGDFEMVVGDSRFDASCLILQTDENFRDDKDVRDRLMGDVLKFVASKEQKPRDSSE